MPWLEEKKESECMYKRKNGKTCVMLALLSVIALALAGTVLLETDDSSAVVTQSGDLFNGGEDIGQWSVDGEKLIIEATTLSPTCTDLDGYSSTTISSVSIKGIYGDIRTLLTSLDVTCSDIVYTGDMPTTTPKAAGGNYWTTFAVGTWTYSIPSDTITVERTPTAGSNVTLTSYESEEMATFLDGYFFKTIVSHAEITGDYTQGGYYLFTGFTGLRTLVANNLTSFSASLCNSAPFTDIEMNKVTSISNYAFLNNTTLRNVSFESVATVGYQAFRTSAIETVVLGSSLISKTTVDREAFYRCGSLVTVEINSINVQLEYYSFYQCDHLTYAKLGTTTVTISYNVFYQCSALETVLLGNGATTIGSNSFFECTNLTKINTDNITQMNNGVFSKSGIGGYKYNGSEFIALGEGEYLEFPRLTKLGETYSEGQDVTGVFEGCMNLTRISMTSLVNAGNCSFEGCSNLVAVDLGSTELTSYLGYRIFYNCASLTTVNNLSITKVQYLGNNSFQGCTSLTSLTLPSTLQKIGSSAFYNCLLLNDVTAIGSLKYIGPNAFEGCSKLTSFTTGSTLEYIKSKAFYNCALLGTFTGSFTGTPTEATSGNSYAGTIETSAFEGCTGLTDVDFGDYLTNLGNSSFKGCTSLVTFKSGITLDRIENNAFSGASALAHFGITPSTWVMPDKLTYIGENAFYGTVIEWVQFTDNSRIATIGAQAFRNVNVVGKDPVPDTAVYGIKFPNTLKTIGNYAFSSSISNLKGIIIQRDNIIESIGVEAFKGCDLYGTLYFNANLTNIGSNAFNGNTHLYGVEFDETTLLTNIPNSAFNGCSGLAHIVLLGQIATIQDYAFQSCDASDITFGPNLTTIGSYAFRYSAGITTLDLPNTIKTIGYEAFRDCESLTEVNLNTLTTLSVDGNKYSRAFYSCGNLTTVDLGDSLVYLPKETFYDCKKLANITWPETLDTIDYRAFYMCNGITSLTLPDSVKTLGGRAFEECDGLLSVDLNGVTSIGTYCFYSCSVLLSVDLGDALTEVPERAFCNCVRLGTIVFSPNLTTIGTYAFAELSTSGNYTYGLKELVIPDSVTTIEADAF